LAEEVGAARAARRRRSPRGAACRAPRELRAVCRRRRKAGDGRAAARSCERLGRIRACGMSGGAHGEI
jgi:hypothetical protein